MLAGAVQLGKKGNELELLNSFVAGDKGDITPGRDIMVRVVEKAQDGSPRITGLLCVRPMFLVHELRVEEGNPLRRAIVEALVNYAFALGKALYGAGDYPPEAVFTVDPKNEKMQEYLRNLGATEEAEGTRLFTIEVK